MKHDLVWHKKIALNQSIISHFLTTLCLCDFLFEEQIDKFTKKFNKLYRKYNSDDKRL